MNASIQIPRGLRNHNPGNIDRSHPRAGWQGALPDDKLTDPRFEQFVDDLHGLRAIGKTLLTYQRKDGCLSIRELIYRWAPRIENDTMSYVTNVCHACDVTPDDSYKLVDVATLAPIIHAIVVQENGHNPFPDALIAQAAALALAP
jgi:hypothetical protein